MTRYRSLDGLRGAAAIVVVVHHCLLVSSVLAASYRGSAPTGWNVATLLTRTPLHVLWDGTGAVLVFFVLSGFVLTLAFTRPVKAGEPRWANYYARRIPRLYVPVWAALALALAIVAIVPRTAAADQSWWINAHASTNTVSSVARDGSLLWNASLLDSPLWSLRWEIVFSLLLPCFVFAAVGWRRLAALKVLAALVLIGVGSWSGHASLLYLPVFMLGCIVAAEREPLRRFTARRGAAFWWAVAICAVVLLSLDSMVTGLPEWLSRPLRSAAAALIVLTFLGCRSVSRAAVARPLQWLGLISFSLYLVHEPIAVSVAQLFPGNAAAVLLLTIPLSLLVAAGVYRVVERPSVRLSHWMGRLEARPSTFWLPTDSKPEDFGVLASRRT
ncbi:MAG TPA: acyltransferase [Frankiaceae bacterium]|jgi:peptidoglycan/LPS O-acetylase OafA/YrhL|nr:acyltransferase [Frankiaceae bacterium]